jgi:hypothetical protein
MFDLRLQDPVVETAFADVLAFLAEHMPATPQS